MTVADIKRGIEDGTLIRLPDGSVRPTSLRESVGLSMVRRLDPKRGIQAQDIIRQANLKALAEKKRKREEREARKAQEGHK